MYVAGGTTSLSLPLHNAFLTSPAPGFIVKFSPDLSQIIISTYFPDAVRALAVDPSGNIYLTGSTFFPSFPVTPGLPAGTVTFSGLTQVSGAFITKLSSTGNRIVYSTVISGGAKDCGCCSSCLLSTRHTGGVSIAVDPAGAAYVAGNTDTSDIPTTTGALLTSGPGPFVAKVNASGTGLAYLTYISSSHRPSSPDSNPANIATAIAVDGIGDAFLTGSTTDPQFPATTGAYRTVFSGPSTLTFPIPPADAFVAKLNPSGSAMVWASYLGGTGAENGRAMVLDPDGNVWVTGITASPDFPNSQGWSSGGDFLVGVNSAGSALYYAARYPDGAASQSVASDANGTIHFAGPGGLVSAVTPAGPPLPRIFGIANSAYGDVGGRISAGELISIYGPHIGPATPVTAVPDGKGNLPNALGGLQVLATQSGRASGGPGIPLQLLYVSDSQINAVAPSALVDTLRIATSTFTPNFPVAMGPDAVEIFQNPDGAAVAVNQDSTVNSALHPAPAGSVVSLWVTGVPKQGGHINPGTIANGPYNSYCCTVSVNSQEAEVLYSGDTPGAVGGVVQINFRVPPPGFPFIAPALIDLSVSTGDGTSHLAGIYVSQF